MKIILFLSLPLFINFYFCYNGGKLTRKTNKNQNTMDIRGQTREGDGTTMPFFQVLFLANLRSTDVRYEATYASLVFICLWRATGFRRYWKAASTGVGNWHGR